MDAIVLVIVFALINFALYKHRKAIQYTNTSYYNLNSPNDIGKKQLYCTKCGSRLETGVNFCTNCGKPIGGA